MFLNFVWLSIRFECVSEFEENESSIDVKENLDQLPLSELSSQYNGEILNFLALNRKDFTPKMISRESSIFGSVIFLVGGCLS